MTKVTAAHDSEEYVREFCAVLDMADVAATLIENSVKSRARMMMLVTAEEEEDLKCLMKAPYKMTRVDARFLRSHIVADHTRDSADAQSVVMQSISSARSAAPSENYLEPHTRWADPPPFPKAEGAVQGVCGRKAYEMWCGEVITWVDANDDTATADIAQLLMTSYDDMTAHTI